jgi:hypothetical protein
VRVVDIHHRLNLCGLDNLRLIEPAELGAERLMWSSSSAKRVFTKIEEKMSDEIIFKTISNKHIDKKVEVVSFDPEEVFTYLIHHLGLSDAAKR